LLRHLFDRHPDLYCGPEWYLFCHRKLYAGFAALSEDQRRLLVTTGFRKLPEVRPDPMPWHKQPGVAVPANAFFSPKLRADSGIDDEFLLELVLGAADFWAFANGLVGEIARRQGKAYWAEKTPINCHAYAEFLAAHPENRCLHLVRDGRDVVPSLLKRGFAVSCAVDRWVMDSTCYLPLARHPRVLLVRFEDLVEHPAPELERIFGFLQIPLRDLRVLLNPSAAKPAASARQGAAAVWDASPEAPIDPAMAWKWRQRKPESLREWRAEFARPVAASAGERSADQVLREFGYPDWDA
jgi:hypothetical protein